MDSFSNRDGKALVFAMIEVIQQNKAYLSEIDGTIGDGDHGINMSKGFTLCKKELEGKDSSLSDALCILGDVLFNEIGGSMGPIYGTLFSEMGEAIKDAKQIDKAVFGVMLHAGENGLREVVNAKKGDKTLIDALAPGVEAYDAALGRGDGFAQALACMKAAAELGRDATKDMVAKLGRASRLGERSRGVLDAGATSCALLLGAIANRAVELLQ